MGWGLLYNPKGKLKFHTLMLATSKWKFFTTPFIPSCQSDFTAHCTYSAQAL
jgi:hypothetical protein